MRLISRKFIQKVASGVELILSAFLTFNCKNSPSSVGGEMNCNKNEKEHLFYCGKCVIIISVDNRKKADI